jgi:adenylate kinase
MEDKLIMSKLFQSVQESFILIIENKANWMERRKSDDKRKTCLNSNEKKKKKFFFFLHLIERDSSIFLS